MSRRRHHRPVLVPLLAALGFAIVLLGCGSGGDDGDDLSTGTDSSSSTTTTEADTTTGSTEASTTVGDGGGDGDGAAGEGGGSDAEGGGPGDGGGSGSGSGSGTQGGGAAGLSPGDECDLDAGIPDCIDPDGDGVGVYLIDGAHCASTAPDVSGCEDADGDGVAGGEDPYRDLPTCGPDVAPPCNNPPGEHER